jgi:hypothetical protein
MEVLSSKLKPMRSCWQSATNKYLMKRFKYCHKASACMTNVDEEIPCEITYLLHTFAICNAIMLSDYPVHT